MTTPQPPTTDEKPQQQQPRKAPNQRAGFGKQHFDRKQKLGYTEQQQYFEKLRPGAQKFFDKAPEQRAQEQLGYVPTYFQDPKEVARAHQIIKATPEGQSLPDWIGNQKDQIVEAYNWFSVQNGGRPDTEWKHLATDDPALGYLSSLQGPPQETSQVFAQEDAVKQGFASWEDMDFNQRKALLVDPQFDITQYSPVVRDQILNDPNFDWSRLPKWQKRYWGIMSNPKLMASPMAVAGWRAGGMFGIAGKVGGAVAGYGLGLIGGQQYDPTAGVFEQPTTVAGMMAVLNKLSEGAEQTIGYTGQVLDAAIAGAQGNEQAASAANKMLFDQNYRRATWEAGRFTYEASDFLGTRNWIPGIAKLLGDEKAVLAGGGQDFIIGSAAPVDRARARGFNPVTGNFYDVTDSMGILQEARLTLHKAMQQGASEEEIRQVIRDMLGEQGQYVGAQVADFAGQMAIDPLEILPEVTNKVSGKLASLMGNETAARAFTETRAPFEAARRYKTLVQTGDVAAGFDYAAMPSISRWVAGVNEKGQITAGPFTSRGLLDAKPETTNAWGKLKEDWAALTPEARAREGASMFYNNMGALLSTFDDPLQVGKFIKSLSGSDMKLWQEMGGKIANSPEFYTVLPALKDFDAKTMDGLTSAWEVSAPKRDALMKISDVLGEEPGRFIEDLAKRGTAEQDFQRVVKRLQESKSPQAKQLLAAIDRGEFTAASLADIVDAFTGEGALYWHPDQFKAATLDALGAHFDEWTANKLGLADEPSVKSAFFRTAHLLKSAQSVLLLGGSPGYALQNGLSNMVHRAATGIYGYMTSNQIDTWLNRFGVEPARLQEGVGMGGMVETATSKGSVQTEAIDKALRPEANDALGKAQRFVSGIGRKMPFNKLSSWFESIEGKNAYMIAMRDMWSKTWKRGVGFSEVTPELRGHMERAGMNPNTFYALIEAGMNKAEIEQHILGRQSGILARSLVNDAAQQTGMTSSQASAMLEKIGVLDELDRSLQNANTPDRVRNAFKNAMLKAQDYTDMQTARDLQAMAENVKNKLGAEGAPAALDIIQQVNSNYFDIWQDHYYRGGELAADLAEIPDMATKNKAYDLYYKISDAEFRRINARTAANYQAIFETWGRSQNPHAMQILASLAQQDAAMKHAYDFMRETRKQYFAEYGGSEPGDLAAQAAWFDGQAKIDTEFSLAFDAKNRAEKAQGDAMGTLYEEMYGTAAGEAARKWWNDYTTFSADIVKREKKFRQSLAGLDKEAREAAKHKYYSEDKVAQIAELETINIDGIRRLEKVIKKGGEGGQGGIPKDPTQPRPPSPFEDVNQLLAEAEQRKAIETQQKAEQVAAVWDMAESFNRAGLPYDRTILQDKFALLGALKKEVYGGIPDLTGLDDPRLTPDKVREVLDNRDTVRANEEAAKVQSAVTEAVSTVRVPKINENTNILRAISEHGGLSYDLAKDLTGDTRPKISPGVFRKKGIGIDEMARMLADDGYPIDLNRVDDLGGIQQTTELLNAARNGDRIYPMNHDHDAMLARVEWDAAEKAMVEALQPEPFDTTGWQAELDRAVRDGDLTAMYERMGELPEEMGNQTAPSGETWNNYLSRIADETAARVEQEGRDTAIAEGMVRAEEAMAEMQTRADAAMTRQLFREKIQEAFSLTDEQANTYMELSDQLAEWYQRQTGQSGDEFYSRYYEDIRADAEGNGELYQLEPVNRRMNQPELEGYARALNRQGEAELARAIKNEASKADRVAILNEVHKLNPKLAETVAKNNLDVLFQNGQYVDAATGLAPKGAVTFGPDGIRATIHAFEAGDFSTVIHENAHVYRRMLADVVSRTRDGKLQADLRALEEWAGAKDGVWDTAAEEKFARGFEKYITDGEAPTPKLRRAFESFRSWMLQVYRTITGSAIDVEITPEVKAVFDRMVGEERLAVSDQPRAVDGKKVKAKKETLYQATATNPFEGADKPFGSMDEASGFKADSEWQDEGYRTRVKPLLEAMQNVAVERLNERPVGGAMRDMSPEGQKMLSKYIKQVQNDMGAVKLSTMKWGESQRDFAMLNYNRRYGFDKYLEVIAPYQFYYTRSLMTWGMRALDKPSWFANYARIRNMQNRYERDIPERLRNKFKIDAPWLPDWMGDALYIDPIQNLFTPANFARPFEQMRQDKTQQITETERVLQEWAADGSATQDDILKAAQTQEGSLWERAQAEAATRREAQISSPFDFMATLFGPAWYLSTPLNMAGVEVPFLSKGDKNKVNSTPLLNTSRAVETVTKGTWAEPIGQMIGMFGKPEQWLRDKQGLPEFGEYGDYYVDRQIANMVADGLITSQQAQVAMIERQGEIFDQARERVKMELALRVPLAGTLYAGTHEGVKGAAQAFLPSLFGSGLLPAGELEYRGLKQEWNNAWKVYDAGDKTAVTNFFDEHPEYEAYLAKGKKPEERLRSFMIGNIWDAYMALGETNQKQARTQMGDEFASAFLNKETRSYDSIDVTTLTRWSQMLNTLVPQTEQTAPALQQPPRQLDLYSPEVTAITDRFYRERKEKYNDYYFLERGYYSLPKSDRPAYLRKFPHLKEYWDWKHGYYEKFPELQPIFKGQVFKTVDTSAWPPALEDYVAMYAMTGKKLPSGAYKALEQVWIREGMPMDDLQSWLDSQVVPAMLYQQGGGD